MSIFYGFFTLQDPILLRLEKRNYYDSISTFRVCDNHLGDFLYILSSLTLQARAIGHGSDVGHALHDSSFAAFKQDIFKFTFLVLQIGFSIMPNN